MMRVKRSEVRGQRSEVRGQALNPQPSTLNHSGATLSEVLISLMVMGIGVTSLALLISTSVLRSIQATQLTNATIHRMNAEQLIQLFPRLVHDPNANTNLTEHNSERFIVDPIGWNASTLNVDFTPIAPLKVNDVFGNNGSGNAMPANFVRRYNGGFTVASDVMRAAYLGDTWQLSAKGTVNSSTSTSITVPSGIDLTTAQQALASNSLANPVLVRVVLYSRDGRESVTRTLTAASMINPATYTIDWSGLAPAQPLSSTNTKYYIDANGNGVFDGGDTWAVSRFRLEIYDARYSWLLTVRKTPNSLNPAGDAHVDVVVFHKRTFSVAAEQLFTGTWSNSNGLAVPPNYFDQLTLNLAVAPAGTKPFLKKGGFLFDTQTASWYRIVQVKNESTVNPLITFDKPISATAAATSVVAMPGVVEVYPIGTISYDINNPP